MQKKLIGQIAGLCSSVAAKTYHIFNCVSSANL
ncbi:hypothetical protein EDD64_11171 [Effusibacillus lacus]|nr:hypothetical protein EDD64_11171 [Effusibacillus lacus]